jgi:hypothetical protein
MPVTIVGNNTPTAGGVVYGDGTNYASTAAGTSGQVLQSNGSSAPTWATPSAGAMTLLSTVTASNSATVDIETTFSSTYDTYVILGSGIGSDGSATPYFQVRLKLGGSYSSASYYAQVLTTRSGSTSVANTTNISQIYFTSTSGIASNSTANLSFVLYINNPSSTSINKNLNWTGSYQAPTGGAAQFSGGGYNDNTAALTGVRFFQDSGNIIRGTFRLYGISNS